MPGGEEPAPMPERSEARARILVVDDQPNNLIAVEAVLSPLGQELVMVRSGEEALRHLLDEDFAVVLLDVMMPGMTGFDVARMMREREHTRNVPIIFFTAREPERHDVLQGYLHRAADYLVKPFDPDVLRAKVSVFVDLHRAREAGQQLAREEERRLQAEHGERRLRQMLMQAPVAVAVLAGPQHRVELANERFCRLIGRTLIEGKRLVEAMPELASTALVELLDGIWANGDPFSATEYPVFYDRNGDGHAEQSYFDFNVEVLRDEQGQVRGLMTAATDVTDHVNARRVRDDFLGIASHELKTPLTTLRLQSDSLAHLMARGPLAPERIASKVETMRAQVGRLEALIAALLDVSRISAGRLPLATEDVDLSALAREVVERFAEELAQSGCTVTLRAELPILGHWDRLRLDQVITNLLTNAMKYGKGKPIEVAVVADGPDTAELSVTDHGIGIALENQERVFERFERAVTPREYGGLGLGLWIVARIVQESGGLVDVHSAPGEGARFTIRLPR
jgi:PAS domain S-box-containing protein